MAPDLDVFLAFFVAISLAISLYVCVLFVRVGTLNSHILKSEGFFPHPSLQ